MKMNLEIDQAELMDKLEAELGRDKAWDSIRALFRIQSGVAGVVANKNANYPNLPKSKVIGATSGRTKYMTKEEQLAVRLRQVGKTVRYGNGAEYEIVGAKWNQFVLKYKSGAENDPDIATYKTATCLRAIERVRHPSVKYANLRKFTTDDGRTVQVWSEGLGLVHNPYTKKN